MSWVTKRKLSAPWHPASGDTSSGGPQHLGADRFDCRPEMFDIIVYYLYYHMRNNDAHTVQFLLLKDQSLIKNHKHKE